MIFEAGANDLPFIVQILRANEPHYAVHKKRIEHARHAIGAGFQGQLIHAMMRFGGKSAALARLEIHPVVPFPWNVALPVMILDPLPALTQHLESDAEALVRRL